MEYKKIIWSGEPTSKTHQINKWNLVPIIYTFWTDLPKEVYDCWKNIWLISPYFEMERDTTAIEIFTVRQIKDLIDMVVEFMETNNQNYYHKPDNEISKIKGKFSNDYVEGVEYAILQYLDEKIPGFTDDEDNKFLISYMFD